jgi:hypothetical protein
MYPKTNMVGPQLSEKVVQSISKAIMLEQKSLDPNKLFRFLPCCNTSDPCTTMTSKIKDLKKPVSSGQKKAEDHQGTISTPLALHLHRCSNTLPTTATGGTNKHNSGCQSNVKASIPEDPGTQNIE